MRCFQGIKIPFGSGNTPVWQGGTRRFDPHSGAETPLLFLPISGIPTTLAQNRPREASPTGKSGMGVAQYSIAWQPLEFLMERSYLFTDPDPIYKNEGRLITQGVIDPYAAQIRTPAQEMLGPVWRA